ncbi:RNA polymerase sigma factor [Lapidilactobacillus mulanensis]|uniref:RNA polymerase sigma factor n=1 Tax=Lapidilactobacillus mulanensis TaxID=2485999 RepID=A0ABW4DN94_9LACO|nr:sigma-70 family RNA polymerase sigma factor [Lapidilactobacillus mulanensis]
MAESQIERIYVAYADELLWYALSLTQNKTAAEGLVSDAFFQLMLQKELPSNLKFWLFRVAKNKFIDATRRQKRWEWLQIDRLSLKNVTDVENDFLNQEKYQRLHAAVAQLPSSLLEVVVLYYFCDWTTVEIGEYLQVTTVNVRVRLTRGRQKLREVLQDE